MPNGHILTSIFIERLEKEFRLDWNGVHGVAHWARVRSNGLRLAMRTGANIRIVEYFAFLHDVCRHNEGKDPQHGDRAADFARSLRNDFIDLVDDEFELLVDALIGHNHFRKHADRTVLTCWDADRLDLLRVGTVPDPARLYTAEGRNPMLIVEACANAQAWVRQRETEAERECMAKFWT